MKGNFSRENHKPSKNYSGVYQVQGGMVTDADLGEQSRIAQARTDDLGLDTVGSGVPEKNGAVLIESGDMPRLTEGVVYAEGVRGATVASGALTDALAYYQLQSDFPLPPNLLSTGDALLYADIWHRTVTHLEDEQLSDPGLHGAETALRTRTTTQIKWMPLAQKDSLGDSDAAFPKKGAGQLTVTPVDPETIGDDCDPCADVVTAAQTVSNGLFRIEVVHVFGDAQTPNQIQLAWSDENASAVAPTTVNSEDFSRAGAVYEYYSDATEKHLGVHHTNSETQRSSFGESLAAGPTTAHAPEGGDWPFVRRWSGSALIDFNASTAARVGGGSGVAVSGRTVTVTTDAFTAEINFTNVATVAGDYWLVELRQHSETPIRAVSSTPLGIEHHYCPLFEVSDGIPVKLNDEKVRRLSFPTLADVEATHVGLDNNCNKLYGDAENVQEALDNLCSIDASDIAFDSSNCTRLYDSTDNVQDALDNLCKVNFGNDQLLRLLHDWGVICGVIPALPKRDGSEVSFTKGAILDQMGELGNVKATRFDLNSIVNKPEFFHFSSFDQFDAALRKKDVCLALAVGDGGDIEVHLATKNRAFGQNDASFFSVYQECMKKNAPYDFKKPYGKRNKGDKAVLDKVLYGAGKKKIAASQRLNSREQIVARNFNDEIFKEYKTFVDDEASIEALAKRIQEIDEEIAPEDATGEVRETRFMIREAMVYHAYNHYDSERIRKCLCNALMPRCPTPGDAPHLVPIACITGVTDNQEIFISDVCAHACRKQAMSWRSMNYYLREVFEQYSQQITQFCCAPPPNTDLPEGPPKKKWPREWHFDPKHDFTLDGVGTKIDEGLHIFTGRKSPSDYRVKVDIDDLGIDQAKIAFKGNGIEVADTIEINDTDAISKIKKASVNLEGGDLVLDAGEVAPGDKVALIVNDGMAIDYVKLETGGGKFLYQPTETGKVTGNIPGSTDNIGEVEQDLKRLKEEREKLSQDMAALNESMTSIRNEKDSIESEVKTAKRELEKISEAQKAAMAEATKEREEIVVSFRKEAPVSSVNKENTAFTVALAKEGITNLGELAELSDDDLKKAARAARIPITVARRAKQDAKTRIEKPIS